MILAFAFLFAGVAIKSDGADALSYSQTEFAVTSYEDLEFLLSNQDKDFAGKTVRLYRDFDLTVITSAPVTFATFAGTFDGNGHVLSGIKSNFFGEITATGVVRNVVFTDCNVTTKASLASLNRGVIQNVYFHGAHACSPVEGVVTENRGTVDNVRSYLTIVTSAYDVYPLTKSNYATFSGCVYVGSVYSASEAEPYSVSVAEENGDIVKTTSYTFFNFYGLPGVGSATDCAVRAYVQTKKLPLFLVPNRSVSYDCDVVVAFTNETDTQYPMAQVAAGFSTVTKETVSSLDDDAFTGTVSSYYSLPTTPFEEGFISALYNVGTYEESVYAGIDVVYDASKNVSSDFSDLSSDYLTFTDYYPVNASLVNGEGTSVSPVLLDNAEDFYLLGLFVPASNGTEYVYAQVTDNVDFSGRKEIEASWVGTKLSVAGEGYLLYGNAGQTLFGSAFSVTYSTDPVFGPPSVGGPFVDPTVTNVVASVSYSGTGTENDPYLLTSAEDFVSFICDGTKNAGGKFAVLSNDILLNTVKSHGNRLGTGLSDLYATVDGCGHTIYGLTGETLLDTVNGTLKNLTIHTVSSLNGSNEPYSAQAVVCLTNAGVLSDLIIKGNASYVCAIADENEGAITRCENHLEASYAVCSQNEGTISYTVNAAPGCASFDGADDGERNEQCVSVSGGVYSVLNEEKKDYSSANNVVLTENGYDMTVFGYETGAVQRLLPSIRKYDKKYKTETPVAVAVNPDIEFGSRYYTDDFIDPDTENVRLGWTYSYGGVDAALTTDDLDDDDFIQEVGVYTLTVTIEETETVLPKVVSTSYSVLQADCGIKASNIDFPALTLTYKGESFSASELELDDSSGNLKTMKDTYGFTFSYSYLSSGDPIEREQIKNAGNNYYQSFTATSKNYKTVAKSSRRITVNKASVTVTVSGETEIRYGHTLGFGAFTASAAFLGTDSGDLLSGLIADYETRFRTDYTTSLAAGSTAKVWFDLSGVTFDNYVLTMSQEDSERGTVTVVKAPVSQGNIVFYGATADERGTCSFDYDGTFHLLSASGLPSGLTYSYSPAERSFRNAGQYVLTLTVDDEGADDNYEELVLVVDVTVSKASLTIKANDLTRFYGYEVAYGNFGYTVEGLCGSDTAEGVLSGLAIAARPSLSSGSIPDYGTYPIVVFDDSGNDFSTTNYLVSTVEGTLSIVKIPLTEVYVNNQSENTDFDNGTKEYDGEAFDLSSLRVTYFEQNAIDVDIEYTYRDENGVLSSPVVISAGTYTVKATVTPPETSNYSAVEYTCVFTVTKKQTSLAFVAAEGYEQHFSAGQYVYTYVPGRTVDYRSLQYVAYTSSGIPDGASIALAGDSPVTVGTYNIRVVYAGDDDHEGCRADATVRVEPYVAVLSVESSYVYRSGAITPNVSVVNTEELTVSDLTYSYKDKYLNDTDVLFVAGSYTMTVGCTDNNYTLAEDTFTVIVTPLDVSISLPALNFVYGTTGNVTVTSGNKDHLYALGESVITYKEYPVLVPTSPDTDPTATKEEKIDVRFRISDGSFGRYIPAGNYQGGEIEQPNNFRLTFSSPCVVSVQKRMLTATWYIKGRECLEFYTAEYSGRSMNPDVSYSLSGFAPGEEITSANYSIIKKNSSVVISTILTVGEYLCSVNFDGQSELTHYRLNYYIDSRTSSFIVRIDKKSIRVYLDDTTVELRENFTGTTVHTPTDDLVGADVEEGRTLTQLSGFNIRYQCAYNASTASVGETYPIFAEITLENYIANIIIDANRTSPALLRVVQNSLPDYVLMGATYVYDGTPKSIVIPSVDSRVRVSYRNNEKTSVGRYLVEATITYTTTGREVVRSAEMNIVPATPTVAVDDVYVVYKAGEILPESLLTCKAYVGDNFPVTGTLSFNGEHKIASGVKYYSVRFDPDDELNLLPATELQVRVKSFYVDSSILDYQGEYTITSSGLSIKNRVTGEIVAERVEEIRDRLQLFQNGNPVTRLVFEEAGTELIEIKFDGETVYDRRLTVAIKSEEEKQETVVINESFFELENVVFDLSSGIIYVSDLGGHLALVDKYADEYALYVDGLKMGSTGAVLSPTDGKVTIEIRRNRMETVYRKQFTVKGEEEMPKETEPKSGTPTFVYIIIGAAGVLVVGGLLLLLLRRR